MTLQESLKVIIQSLTKKIGKTQKQVEKIEEKIETKADKKYVDNKIVISSQDLRGYTTDQKDIQPPEALKESSLLALSSRKFEKECLTEQPYGTAVYLLEGREFVPYIYCYSDEEEESAILIRAYPLAEKVTYSNEYSDQGYEFSNIDQVCSQLADSIAFSDKEPAQLELGKFNEYGYGEAMTVNKICYAIPGHDDYWGDEIHCGKNDCFEALCAYYGIENKYPFINVIEHLNLSKDDYFWSSGSGDRPIAAYNEEYTYGSGSGKDLYYKSYTQEEASQISGWIWPCLSVSYYSETTENKGMATSYLFLSEDDRDYNYLLNMGNGRFKNIGANLKTQFKEYFDNVYVPCCIIDLKGQEITNSFNGLTTYRDYERIEAANGQVYLKNFMTTASEFHTCNAFINMNIGRSKTYKGVYNEVGFDGTVHTYIITIAYGSGIKFEELS